MNDQPEPSQLDRIEAKVDKLVSRVALVERKASFWGALASIIVALASKLTGCV